MNGTNSCLCVCIYTILHLYPYFALVYLYLACALRGVSGYFVLFTSLGNMFLLQQNYGLVYFFGFLIVD